jgi:hypothetical protein
MSVTDRTPTPYQLARAHADTVQAALEAKIGPELQRELQAVIDADSAAVDEWTLENLAKLASHLPGVGAAIPHIWASLITGQHPDTGLTCTLCEGASRAGPSTCDAALMLRSRAAWLWPPRRSRPLPATPWPTPSRS